MQQVAPGVHQLTIQRFVNLYFVETGTPGEWVLVDTGLPGSEKAIIEAADKLFYPGTHPEAIILTHGHMDHAGSAQALSEHWNVPVLAHPLELPFLTGKAVYPPADPTVEGGGSLAFVSRFFPPQSFNLSKVQALPDNDVDPPFLPDWQWYHVPGHAPGQVALFREKDRTLIGGDAFATANHESVPSLLLQRPCISVAGAPFNYDWQQVRDSVRQLAELQPQAIGCGHGPVITGLEATMGLQRLADEFPLPLYGRYAYTPARLDENGVAHLPVAPPDQLPKKLLAVAGAGLLAAGLTFLFDQKKKKKAKRPKPESPTHKTPKKFRRQSAKTWE